MFITWINKCDYINLQEFKYKGNIIKEERNSIIEILQSWSIYFINIWIVYSLLHSM